MLCAKVRWHYPAATLILRIERCSIPFPHLWISPRCASVRAPSCLTSAQAITVPPVMSYTAARRGCGCETRGVTQLARYVHFGGLLAIRTSKSESLSSSMQRTGGAVDDDSTSHWCSAFVANVYNPCTCIFSRRTKIAYRSILLISTSIFPFSFPPFFFPFFPQYLGTISGGELPCICQYRCVYIRVSVTSAAV